MAEAAHPVVDDDLTRRPFGAEVGAVAVDPDRHGELVSGKDGLRGTFDQFYPSNHGYYGMIDQFGWKNLKNRRAGFDCQPSKKLYLE